MIDVVEYEALKALLIEKGIILASDLEAKAKILREDIINA